MVYNFELGLGLSICIGFILVIGKLKLKNYSNKNTENGIQAIQSNQLFGKQIMLSSSSSSSLSSSSSTSRRTNPFTRLIQGFTGAGNATQCDHSHDIEGEEFGRHSHASQKPKQKPAMVDTGSQVCQEIFHSPNTNTNTNTNTNPKGGAAAATKEEESKLSAQYTCAICLDVLCLGNTNMTTTGCGHTFHFSCLLKSLRTKNLCPLCRWELEETRPNPQASNILTPVSAEQIIVEEISYFPNAAHAQSITQSRHPKRRLKELLRIFGFTLLRTVAEYVHDGNMPVGWYDDGDSDESDNEEEETDDNETQHDDDDDDDDADDYNEAGFVLDTRGRRPASPIVGDLRENIGGGES